MASPRGSIQAIPAVLCAAATPLGDSSQDMFLANIKDGPLVRINGSHQVGLVWHRNQHANILWIRTFFFMHNVYCYAVTATEFIIIKYERLTSCSGHFTPYTASIYIIEVESSLAPFSVGS